ncbi:hypothetical protein ACWCPF_06090 [Streptomyces sp. NPDC001858]
MQYLIIGVVGVFAGIRALALRRKQLSGAGGASAQLILRPSFLAVLAGIAIVGGAFLLAGGVAALMRG